MNQPNRRARLRKRTLSAGVVLVAFFLLVACGNACGPAAKHWGPLAQALIESARFRSNYPGLEADVPYVPGAGDARRLDIYRTTGPTPAPVVVFVHGGYWKSGHRSGYAALGQSLHDQGFVTVLIDYRMFPKVTYPAFVEDCVAACNWIHAHIGEYGGDPNRMVLAGHSAGTHLVAITLLDDTFRKQLTFDPMSLAGLALLSGPYDFERDNLLDPKILRNVMGSQANVIKAQPIKYVRPDMPPTLVLNGDRDPLAGEVQARRFSKLMQEAGAPLSYEMLLGGDHHTVVLQMVPKQQGVAFEKFIDFLRRVTAPAS